MLCRLTFLSLFTLLYCSAWSQDGQLYVVRHIDFKAGMENKGMEIGMKYFNGGNSAAGKKVDVYRFHTGPWDAIIMEPIADDSPITDVLEYKGPHSAAVWKAMLEIAGGDQEALLDAIRQYRNCVIKEELSICRAVPE